MLYREATSAMTTYLTPSMNSVPTYDPPCPIFSFSQDSAGPSRPHKRGRRIIELGSGQSVASLHLSQYLASEDTLVLTDLPEVVPLCQKSIDRINRRDQSSRNEDNCPGRRDTAYDGDVLERVGPDLIAAPLPWGGSLDGLPGKSYDFILLCDLVRCTRFIVSLRTHEYQ